MKALSFVAAVACAAGCDVDRVAPGFYRFAEEDDSVWIELQVVSGQQLGFMMLSTESDRRFAVAYSQLNYGFRKDSCVLSFLLETEKARALVFPDAKRNKASYGLNAQVYEGVVRDKSSRIFLDDAEFARVKRSSLWDSVEQFAKIHKVKLPYEDARLVHRARSSPTRAKTLSHFGRSAKGFHQFSVVLDRMPARDDEILSDVGWLRVSRRMSESAFGIVFAAEWKQLGKENFNEKNSRVALKVSLPGKEKDFIRECKVMEMMHGVKGFPWVHAQFLQGPHYYFFTNLIGESLTEILNSNKGLFPANGIVVVAVQVLQRLQSLHKADLVMIDLSPDNVFVDHKGKVYLSELGLAQELRDKRSLQEELSSFFELIRFIRSAGREHTDADSVWIQLEDYIATHESPDYAAIENILVKQWGASAL